MSALPWILSTLLFVQLVGRWAAWLDGAQNAFAWKRTFRRSSTDAPYMIRRQLFRSPWVDVYVNKILREDFDPNPHNHPWCRMWSLKLWNSYLEQIYWGPGLIFQWFRSPKRWSEVPRIHRIVSLTGGRPCWTLFIGFRRHKDWGFFDMTRGGAFVRHDQHLRGDAASSTEADRA